MIERVLEDVTMCQAQERTVRHKKGLSGTRKDCLTVHFYLRRAWIMRKVADIKSTQ